MVGMSILETKWAWRRPEAERRRRPLQLSQLERDNVRRGLRSLLAKYGRVRLARAMKLSYDALRKVIKRAPTMRVALAVAYVARVDVDDVLAGEWPSVCPHCGRCE